MLEPGLYNISLYDYHYGIGAFAESKSNLAYLLHSPRKYKYEKDNPEHLDIFDLKAKKFNEGQAFHLFFLQPNKFKEQIVIIPEFKGKGSKLEKEQFQQEVRDNKQIPVNPEIQIMLNDFDKLLNSGEHENTAQILQDSKALIEISGFWQDPQTEIWLKERPDLISNDNIIWDLKKHTTLQNFKDQAYWLHYDLQAYMALQGISIITGIEHYRFGFIVFHANEAPYDIELLECDEMFINSGQEKFFKCISLLRECRTTDNWPGKYPDEVGLLNLPRWRSAQLINEGKFIE